MLVPSVSIAQSPDQVPAQENAQGSNEEQAQESQVDIAEEPEELDNGLLFGFSHALRLVRNRRGAAAGDLRRSDNLYGFLLGYERVLHRYLALSIIKPFYFNSERVDSSLEVVLAAKYRKNSWEPFLGAGVVSTISRITEEEGGESVETVEFSVGLLLIVGFKYFFTRNWAIELEFGYELVPNRTTVEHAFADSYQGAYFF
jgi:opacity protein-like surface antigen